MFYDDSMPEKIEQVINADLANVDKWYEANGMRRNTYEEKVSKQTAILKRMEKILSFKTR